VEEEIKETCIEEECEYFRTYIVVSGTARGKNELYERIVLHFIVWCSFIIGYCTGKILDLIVNRVIVKSANIGYMSKYC